VAPQEAAARTSAVWTVPNLISMARLAGVPLFLWLVIGPQADVWALVVLMVAGFSDWLDGYLARRLDQTSRLGEILDPVADRLYILAAVVGLLYRGYSALPVHYLGKAATAALLYAFPLLFLGDGDGTTATIARVVGWAFAVWGIGLYWWAGLLYAWQVRVLMTTQQRRAPKGHRAAPGGDPRALEAGAPGEAAGTDQARPADRPDRADA
jgi:cardiolipin synthase